LAPRTVYVRFGTKAARLQRVIDVAIAGDTEPIAVVDREWYRVAPSADSLAMVATPSSGRSGRR
jgi:hypothetical protein